MIMAGSDKLKSDVGENRQVGVAAYERALYGPLRTVMAELSYAMPGQ